MESTDSDSSDSEAKRVEEAKFVPDAARIRQLHGPNAFFRCQEELPEPRRVMGGGAYCGRMKPRTREAATVRAQARLHGRAVGGLHLPSQLARIVARQRPENLVPQERPLTLMHGGADVTAELEENMKEAAWEAAGISVPEGERATHPAFQKVRKSVAGMMSKQSAVPEYIQHFNGRAPHAAVDPSIAPEGSELRAFIEAQNKFSAKSSACAAWTAPVVDVEAEEVGWRKRKRKREEKTRFQGKHERLAYEFKRARGDLLTATEAEEELAADSEPESEDELHEMRKAWLRESKKRDLQRRREQESAERAAAEKAAAEKAAAEEAAAAARADQDACEELLAQLGTSDESDEAPGEEADMSFTDHLSEEETDLEDRFYPDAVPHFLLDRKSSYAKISDMRKPKVPARAAVSVQEKWWLKLDTRKPAPAPTLPRDDAYSSDDDIEIDCTGPDAIDVAA